MKKDKIKWTLISPTGIVNLNNATVPLLNRSWEPHNDLFSLQKFGLEIDTFRRHYCVVDDKKYMMFVLKYGPLS